MQRTFLVIGGAVVACHRGGGHPARGPGQLAGRAVRGHVGHQGRRRSAVPSPWSTRRARRSATRDVIDRPSLVYFGYMFCPDVCPVDVQVMADAVDLAGRARDRGAAGLHHHRPCPGHRGRARTAYAEAMHPQMVGLTGTDAQIKATADPRTGSTTRSQDAGGSAAEYLMQHTVFTYLVCCPARAWSRCSATAFRRNRSPTMSSGCWPPTTDRAAAPERFAARKDPVG